MYLGHCMISAFILQWFHFIYNPKIRWEYIWFSTFLYRDILTKSWKHSMWKYQYFDIFCSVQSKGCMCKYTRTFHPVKGLMWMYCKLSISATVVHFTEHLFSVYLRYKIPLNFYVLQQVEQKTHLYCWIKVLHSYFPSHNNSIDNFEFEIEECLCSYLSRKYWVYPIFKWKLFWSIFLLHLF